MDLIVTTAIAFTAIGVMVAYALRSTQEHLPVRIRADDQRANKRRNF